ncbi:adenosine receptor A1-like [Conger conger]|uniref:adenosine receptor A1-like n=1 Tax=Conger conger TaxID=82655 RepID=UPI002A5A801C|nr:adenosine receptor A1-like [Conger conger]
MTIQKLYIALEILVGLACCLGNLLVVWAVCVNRSLRQPTFCFVVSLAGADFLVGAVAIPLALLVDGKVSSFYGCLFSCCVLLVLTQSSVLSLLAIAVDRYLRVRTPLRYRRMATQRRAWVAVALCWLLSCVLGFVPLLGWHKPWLESPGGYGFTDVMDMSYMIYFNFFGCILAPLAAMVLIYAWVFRNIRKHLRENAAGGSECRVYYLKERSLAQSLALVLTLFTVCWLPLHIMNCVSYFRSVQLQFYAGILLSHANSALNPVVYAFKIRKFQKAYRDIWSRYFLCRGQDGPLGEQSADNLGSTSQSDRVARAGR